MFTMHRGGTGVGSSGGHKRLPIFPRDIVQFEALVKFAAKIQWLHEDRFFASSAAEQ
jgi:hypothetical protein|tara:strand:- start:558 stop:728 length:171 start_codon:yes stop_codon:yes gene_type:complete